MRGSEVFLSVFSRGHASLHLAVSVSPSVGRLVTFLNSQWFLHYCSCPTVSDWIAVYPALFIVELVYNAACKYLSEGWMWLFFDKTKLQVCFTQPKRISKDLCSRSQQILILVCFLSRTWTHADSRSRCLSLYQICTSSLFFQSHASQDLSISDHIESNNCLTIVVTATLKVKPWRTYFWSDNLILFTIEGHRYWDTKIVSHWVN